MTSHLDHIVQRRGSGSYKWDAAEADAILPMWVADMDFRTAPAIIKALERRVRHGIFGYAKVGEPYYDAVIRWFARRHGLLIERDWILYTSGVVPALSAIIRALAEPGDRVIVQTPVYNCFFSSIRNMGCEPLESDLLYRDGRYEMDFEDLDRKAADPRAKLLLLCNPHNPVGRVWTALELSQLAQICQRHGVTVISDEIHCDLIMPGRTHIPFATIDQACMAGSVTCTSPSKAFNLAGLQIANIIVSDAEVRRRIDRVLNIHEVCDVNVFGIEALIAAYTHGEAWLADVNRYISGNYLILRDFIWEKLPRLSVVSQEATYLTWIDCKAIDLPSAEIAMRLRDEANLWVNEGSLYGASGEGFIRMNIACPSSLLKSGLERLWRILR